MNDFDVRSTVSRAPLATTSVRVPVVGSTSHAPRLETTSAFSIPGDVTPPLAGHADAPVAALLSVSSVHSAIGTFGSASVSQSTRQ